MLSSGCKEGLQLLRRFAFPDAGKDLGTVMAGWMAKDPRTMDDAAAFRIFRGECQLGNARERNGRGTHRTRLKGHPKLATV